MYTDPFAHLVRMEEYRNVDQKILEKLPERPKRSHKGMFGKALCIAGSVNMAGAAYLCAGAAYRSGAGLVKILTPEENRVILQTLLPEAVMTTFEQNEREALDNILEEALSWATVAAIGPGLGRKPWAYHMMKLTLQKFHGPLVIDADALNILSEHMEWLEQHEGNVILTPHVGEFSRLTGVESWEISKDISGWAAAFAREHHCICILKDAPSAAALPDGTCYVNTTGNSGMSTGGSGDVLTGILTGLLAQKVDPSDVALLGMWLHGKAGDLAMEQEGVYGLLARHLLEYLPGAMKKS